MHGMRQRQQHPRIEERHRDQQRERRRHQREGAKAPISRYEITRTQKDADSASRSSPCTTSRLKKYR